jgi:autotransporter-associated beta strand protein
MLASSHSSRQKFHQRAALAVAIVIFSSLSSIPTLASPPAGYYLVWGDEFNGASLDTNKWMYWELGPWGNAVNATNAVSLNGSNLVITTYTSGTNYTAMLASQNSFRPRYGYYEASIKWGDTNGMWSAFWLRSPTMGTYLNDAFASGGELDCCEHRYVGIQETNYIANIVSDNSHWDGYGAQEQNAGSDNVGTDLQTGFHTYGLLWDVGTYSFSIDGGEVWNGTPAPVFGSDVYILLSSQVNDSSTTWAGYIPPAGYGSQATSAVKMTVDYFHYYAPTNVLFWTAASSVYWTNPANWVSNYLPAAASDLTFSYLSSNLNSELGGNISVDGLIFLGMLSSASIGGGNTLTLGAGGIDMAAADQNVTLNTPIDVALNQTWRVGINNPGNILTVNSDLSGAATLTKAGYGTLFLNGANSFSGVLNIDTGGSATNDGFFVISRSAAIASVASPIFIRNTGTAVSTLQISNGVAVPQTISGAGRNTNVAALEILSGSAATSLGGLTLTGGGSNYIVQCDGGTLDLAGTISAGDTVTNACSLILQGAGNFSIPGAIENGAGAPFSVVKTNSGALTLSGANTFTGGTTNVDGNLFLNGSLAGPLTVTGGTLAGTGSVAGPAVIQGGEISPGSGLGSTIGTLSFGSNLTFGPRILVLMDINAATQTSSQLNVAGTLTFGGTLYVANLGGTLSNGQSFQLFNAGTYAGSFGALTLPSLNPGLAWNTNGLTNGVLSVDALPQTFSISNFGAGQVQLNWEYGTLETATNVSGPYSNILGASPPYTVPATNPQQFFLLRE